MQAGCCVYHAKYAFSRVRVSEYKQQVISHELSKAFEMWIRCLWKVSTNYSRYQALRFKVTSNYSHFNLPKILHFILGARMLGFVVPGEIFGMAFEIEWTLSRCTMKVVVEYEWTNGGESHECFSFSLLLIFDSQARLCISVSLVIRILVTYSTQKYYVLLKSISSLYFGHQSWAKMIFILRFFWSKKVKFIDLKVVNKKKNLVFIFCENHSLFFPSIYTFKIPEKS